MDRYKNTYHDIMFKDFVGKEGKIKGVSRLDSLIKKKRWYFEGIEGMVPFEPMFYRPNLADHSEMVAWIAMELLPYAERAYPGYFDKRMKKKALTLALVHDDIEILSGDESSYAKDKWNKRQQKIKVVEELEFAEKLARQYPEEVNGFNYKELVISTIYKDENLPQFISVCDKVLGLGEAFQELYTGNSALIIDPNDENNRPVQRYIEKFLWKKEEAKGWSKMGPLFRRRHTFLNRPKRLTHDDLIAIANDPNNKPYTDEESVRKPTGNKFYDKYKEVIMERGGQRGLELLTTQREFPDDKSEHPFERTGIS